MKIVKTFYANDGKKFDDEFECRKYEQMLMEMEMLVNEREMACEKTRSFELK